MKIYILFELKNGATGGGNQFLKAMRDYFIKVGTYTEKVEDAGIVLLNSHQYIDELLKIKLKYPNKLFIHRIDGPMRLYNSMNDKRDLIVNIVNKYIADGTVFQSNWSKEKNYLLGMKKNNFETTILNAPNPLLFNKDNNLAFSNERKVKIIATSWSSNWKKGFEVYQWLDENLDFDRYDMTFVGNSPIEFKNIKHKEPMNSEALALELKQNDIFITASQSDPCSNSLIEAIHCGLPAIGLNDGGHTQIISDAGEVFNQKEEIPKLLEKIVKNYESYQTSIKLPNIDEVGNLYYEFFRTIYENKTYAPKQLNMISYFKIKVYLTMWKIEEKFFALKKRIFR